MEDYYTIQTPGHHSTMFAELHVLQKQGVMCDVILAAEDGEVMAHKVVLMAASKYFREKLSPVIGPTASKICLKGISVVELANLVKYIYTGKLLVAKETMDITLEISEILQLQGVMHGYKEIITYEQMKENPSNAVPFKSEYNSNKTPPRPEANTSYTEKTYSPQKTNAQIPKAVEPVTATPDELAVSTVSKTTSDTLGSQQSLVASTEIVSLSSVSQADAIQDSNVPATEPAGDGVAPNAHHVDNAGDAADVNNTQTSSTDFNFDSLYDQQYMDVSAGARTPSKNPGTSTQPSAVTLPKLQQMAPNPSESQKIAEERAQHQDLLAVAIETLSDVPYLKQQPHQPEVDKAVSSISGPDAAQPTTQAIPQHVIGMKPEEEDLEDYENGLTCTKTVTMSAGSVNNELGGKTDVYTVALDPATVRSPLKMPRPKRTKTAKEKEAEEKAKKYRHIKAVLMSGASTDTKPLPITDVEPRRGSRQKNSTTKQDFQYESLSKTKKKVFSPKIVLIPKDSVSDPPSGKEIQSGSSKTETDPNSKCLPKVIKVQLGEKIKVPKEEKIEAEGDNFGQVVNFDSESDDDVNGLIVNDMLAAFQSDDENNKKSSGKSKDNVGTYLTNLKESQKERGDTKSQSLTKKGGSSNDAKLDNKSSGDTGKEEDTLNVLTNNVECDTTSPDKSNETDNINDDASEVKGLPDDLQAHDIDEATAERMKSSSTKRKTRTPRKLPISDEEKGNDPVTDRHDKIPVVRSRRSSKSLNLDREKEGKAMKHDSDNDKCNETKRKKLRTDFEGGNVDCKDKDLSKATEIKIIAQSKVDEKALGEAEKQINESQSKKIIIVPRYYQPEIRLKKRTTEEMLELAKEIPKNKEQASSGESELEVTLYETEEGDEDDDFEDYEEMSADDFVEDCKKHETHSDAVAKRKMNESFKSSPVKKRKTGNQMNLSAELNEAGNDITKSILASKTIVKNIGGKKIIAKSFIIKDVTKRSETEEQKFKTKVEIDNEDDEIDVVTNKVVSSNSPAGRMKNKGKGLRKKKSVASKEKLGEEIHEDVSKESDEDDAEIDFSDYMVYVCSTDDCRFSSKSLIDMSEHKEMCHTSPAVNTQDADKSDPKKNAKVGPESCAQCGKTFKTRKILKRHIEYSHTEKEKIQCEHCDFATPYKSSMSTHLMISHSAKKAMFMCKFCDYGTPLTGNLRKHLYSAHSLIVITKQHKKSAEYEKFDEGTIITKDHQVFDPETMKVPKTAKRKAHSNKDSDETATSDSQVKAEDKKRTKISLSKLPVEDFLKEMMKRHQEYVQQPEKKYSFMSSSIAVATEHPSFPQASPQVRNTRANKIYNMKKVKPTFTVQPETTGLYGMGNVEGMYHQGTATVPQVASEVEVEHDNQPEVVLENVEDDASTTVLTISEQKGIDGSEMILINQNGKRTIVRSKDFYDTLQATGHDTNQTFGVISALLQAGEQIEIREQQEEIVEIQNM